MNKKHLLFFFFLIFSFISRAQDNVEHKTNANKNSINATLGNAGFMGAFNLSYGYEHGQYMDLFYQPPPTVSDFVGLGFVGSLGYRYQKPKGNFLFCYGIGYPESIYLSLGAAF